MALQATKHQRIITDSLAAARITDRATSANAVTLVNSEEQI